MIAMIARLACFLVCWEKVIGWPHFSQVKLNWLGM